VPETVTAAVPEINSVTVRMRIADLETPELMELRELNRTCEVIFGIGVWESGFNLQSAAYFTAQWARDRAAGTLGLDDRSLLSEWPLDQVDWDKAAVSLRDENYKGVTYKGVTYYGQVVFG
jgi:hypothetical protein